jgi:hypothetical protein
LCDDLINDSSDPKLLKSPFSYQTIRSLMLGEIIGMFHGSARPRLGDTATVYMMGVLEYLADEILEVAVSVLSFMLFSALMVQLKQTSG